MSTARSLITFSKEAVKALQRISHENNYKTLQFSLKGAGCVGFKQELKPIQESDIKKFDEIIKVPSQNQTDDLKIVIDSHSVLKLAGTEIDYETNLLRSGFVFKNPNVEFECGCGESVSFKE